MTWDVIPFHNAYTYRIIVASIDQCFEWVLSWLELDPGEVFQLVLCVGGHKCMTHIFSSVALELEGLHAIGVSFTERMALFGVTRITMSYK